MAEIFSTKNYEADGGDTWVINGKLTVGPDAEVEGLETGGGAAAWADITGKPATFPPVIGTTATTAKAGNAVQNATQTTATSVSPGTATNVQAILAELSARIAALESA